MHPASRASMHNVIRFSNVSNTQHGTWSTTSSALFFAMRIRIQQCQSLFLLKQHSTAQHSTAQHGTAQHSTAQHSTAQHSTAQHGTARHGTAQHSTAQHSTARHSTMAQVPPDQTLRSKSNTSIHQKLPNQPETKQNRSNENLCINLGPR